MKTLLHASLALFGLLASLAATADIVGVWTLTVESPRGTQHPTLTITKNDSGYSGVYAGARGELPIPVIESDGTAFSFPLTISMPMGDMDLEYKGTVNGERMSGEIGNPMGSIPFEGERTQ